MPFTVLGIDPSSEGYTWACVHFEDGERPNFVALGTVAPEPVDYERLVEETNAVFEAMVPDLLALEVPSPYVGQGVKFPHLLATTMVCGVIAANTIRPLMHLFPAYGYGGWRPFVHSVTRPPTGDTWDRMLTRRLPEWVDCLPKRMNTHTRDAVAIALALGLAWSGDDTALARLGAMSEMYTAHRISEANRRAVQDGTRMKRGSKATRPKRVKTGRVRRK